MKYILYGLMGILILLSVIHAGYTIGSQAESERDIESNLTEVRDSFNETVDGIDENPEPQNTYEEITEPYTKTYMSYVVQYVDVGLEILYKILKWSAWKTYEIQNT